MQSKTSKNTRGPNADEKRFQLWLKQRPCCVSGFSGVDVHHMYGSKFIHNKVLIGHMACIPLHPDFHRGKYGIHTIGKNAWVDAHDRQAFYFEKEAYDYSVETGMKIPADVYYAILDWGR